MKRINTFNKFNESQDITKRFVGPNGEFQPTEQPKKGTTTIQFMEELLEWIYYHDNMPFEEKMKFITGIEEQIQLLLNGDQGGTPFGMPINYIPTWSTKLKKDLK
jgi:hypothetical protein